MGKKLEVLVETSASELVEQQIMAEAAAIGAEHASDIIRDAEGKLVKVIVNFSDNANDAGIQTARDNLSKNNPGVSTAVSFPVGGAADGLEDLGTPGDDISGTVIDVGGTKLALLPPNVLALNKWRSGFAADARTGSGCLMLQDDNTAALSTFAGFDIHTMGGSMTLNASDNSLGTFSEYSWKFWLNLSDTLNTVAKDKGLLTHPFTRMFGNVQGIGEIRYEPLVLGNANLWVRTTGSVGGLVDSGSSVIDNYVEIEFRRTAGGAGREILVGGVSKSTATLFPSSEPKFNAQFSLQDVFTSPAGAKNQRPILLDDMTLSIDA